ncbi:MAG: TraG family conjugative transposon ATPase [Chitinophagaceae bacterium]|nr:TraG family conjugative transposon ATPase [Chitinophagaceae bacterium]
MTPYLEARLPIWEVAEDHIVTKAGDSTLAFVLIKPEIFTSSGTALQEIHRTWVKALHTLPANTIVHIMDWYWMTKWQGVTEDGDTGFLSRSSNLFHHERPWMNHCCYLFITRRPARRTVTPGTALLQRHLAPQELLSNGPLREFKAQVSQFIQILTDGGGLQCRQLQTDELASSPGKPGLIERYCQLNMPDEQAVLRDIHFDNGIQIGENHCCLYTLADAEHLPAQCSPDVEYAPYSNEGALFSIGFASPLGLLLACNHIYNQYIFIEDPFQTRKKMEDRSRRMQSLSAHSRENALSKQALDEFLNEATAHGKLMVKTHFNIFSWTDDPQSVGSMRDQVGAAIAKLGATPHLETEGAAQIWCAGIPGNGADLPPYETFDILADQAVCLLTPDTNYRESMSTYGVRLGCRLHGRPLQVDLSDLPMRMGQISNRNKFVLGGSGSGKSFFTNHLVRSYYEQGAHVVVVDIGNSYHGLCALMEGYYFTYKEESPLSLNPFWMPPGEIPDIEKKESLKTLLLALWKKEDEAFLRSEYVALSKALQLYYEKLTAMPYIFPCFDTFYEFLRDEFVVVLADDRVRQKDFDINNFLYVLRPFYKGGEYDFLLNARKQLDLRDQRFIVFELDNIKDHPILFPVVTIVIMEVFISKMRKLPGVRKVILIEEAWKAIARQGMSEYIKYLFKTVRKFFGEAIVVTQEVEDIISSPVVKQAILNNADCKILLDQSKSRNRFDDLQQLLGLTDQDKAMVLSLNQGMEPGRKYKEVFISLGSDCSKVYRTEVSPEEYLTYTTEEREKLRVQLWARKHGSLKKGIAELAKTMKNGAVKGLIIAVMMLVSLLAPSQKGAAQVGYPIAAIVQMAVKRVIVATDLAIQRLQTATIGLQSVQKVLENAMQLRQLTDIADWVRKQKELFAGYYRELWEVKSALGSYHRVKEIAEVEIQIVRNVQNVLGALRRDPHFSIGELEHIGIIYGGVLDRGVRITSQLSKVITGFVTQMQDGDRLEIIDRLGEEMDQQRREMLAFTQENILLSLQRSKSRQEISFIKTLYNIH